MPDASPAQFLLVQVMNASVISIKFLDPMRCNGANLDQSTEGARILNLQKLRKHKPLVDILGLSRPSIYNGSVIATLKRKDSRATAP
jgi:hypothetical protein